MLVLVLILVSTLGTWLALVLVIRIVWRRLEALEESLKEPFSLRKSEEGVLEISSKPLQGLHIAIDVTQDHPHPVFANLLREALLREDAVPDETGPIAIKGNLLCNGYADVYYRAELTIRKGDEALFVLAERPPQGDRQENLAREFVARLRDEMAKHERQSAIRELRG